MNISERTKTDYKSVLYFDIYSAAKAPLPTGDHLLDADFAVQSYHKIKQLPRESTNKYRIRMKDKVRILLRLGLEVPSQQEQAMRFLFSLDPAKHADIIYRMMLLKIQILLTQLILYRCATLRQIGVENPLPLKIKSQLMMWVLILLVKETTEMLEIKVRRRMKNVKDAKLERKLLELRRKLFHWRLQDTY